MYRNRDQNVTRLKQPDRNVLCPKRPRLTSPVPCHLTVAVIDKTPNGFNLCHH